MKLKNFDYHLPKSLIAQRPVLPRDRSRLLVLDRKTSQISHHKFYEIEKLLKPGDVLVLNNSKVIPARLWGRKNLIAPRQARGASLGGGKIEVLLLKKISPKVWEVLMGGKGRREGLRINFKKGLRGEIIKKLPRGIWHIKFNYSGKKFDNILKNIGEAPTPPYIKQKSNLQKYQTIYAKKEGSVAAPTAGFHFTKKLINKLKKKGIQFEFVTLHVGFGTFEPVRVEDIEKHHMHPEFVEVNKNVIKRLIKAKKDGRRIVAVGTTSVRVLESIVSRHELIHALPKRGFRGWINTFIYPGYKFKFVDALITNFHLPKSTLLMLVSAFAKAPADKSAFAGRNKILQAYEIAKRKKYRFYSFGDATLIV